MTSARGRGESRPDPILIEVASRTQWSLLGRLAARLIEAGDRVVVAYEGEDPRAGSASLAPAALDVAELSALTGPVRCSLPQRILDSRFGRVLDPIAGTPDYRHHLRLLRTRLEAARTAIRQSTPRLLIVGEDGISGNALIIEAARERAIPVLVCPYGYGSRRDLEDALEQKQRAGELILAEGRSGATVRRRYPHWVMDTRHGPALLLHPDVILARERLGLGIPDPWTVHGGNADRIAVESEAMRRHYQREGIPEAKLRLTGSVYCDVIHDEIKTDPRYERAFETASRVQPDLVRILVALPPSFHGQRDSEFPSYAELCRATLGFLAARPATRVTVTIHPATRPDDRRAIERMGVRVSDDFILSLLPRHDLYVTCFSSTIRWAIACRKPVLNYDMYRFRLPDYEGVAGVRTVDTQSGFRQLAAELIEDTGRHTLSQTLKAASGDWGIIDGRNFERVHGLIRELSPHPGPSR